MANNKHINEHIYWMMKDKYDSDKANNRLPEGFTGEWKKDYIQYLEFHNQNKEESCPADVKKENEENKVVWYGNK